MGSILQKFLNFYNFYNFKSIGNSFPFSEPQPSTSADDLTHLFWFYLKINNTIQTRYVNLRVFNYDDILWTCSNIISVKVPDFSYKSNDRSNYLPESFKILSCDIEQAVSYLFILHKVISIQDVATNTEIIKVVGLII